MNAHQKNIRLTFNKKNPWRLHHSYLKARCNNPNVDSYRYYGGNGIKALITEPEMKKLWFRDKAYELKRPSVDRIDSSGHYAYENCRFIELSDNKGFKTKLTEEDVQEIRKKLRAGNRKTEIAKQFGICAGHVRRIQLKKKWGWLPDPLPHQ